MIEQRHIEQIEDGDRIFWKEEFASDLESGSANEIYVTSGIVIGMIGDQFRVVRDDDESVCRVSMNWLVSQEEYENSQD